ncbi:MAG: 30S ribosomal protein S11 [Armatimonadetes bacterium]|nr:30S ribosomal protein S11 [Armatimonadota bacterium]
MARKQKVKGKQKEKRQVASGMAYVHSSFNNTIISITDPKGDVLVWSSAGAVNFKGSRKGTPYAAQVAADSVARRVIDQHGLRKVEVLVSGPGSGRETAIRSLAAAGLEIQAIKDITTIPHNGCRPPKKRRV